MTIKREIFVTQKRFDVSIDITYGSNLLPIELLIADYEIPEGATAIAYAKGKSGELKKIVCNISDNQISFTPTAGFFENGKNELQLRVTYDNKSLFSYKCIVKGHSSFSDDDANEVADNPTLVEQLLTQVNDLSEDKASWDLKCGKQVEGILIWTGESGTGSYPAMTGAEIFNCEENIAYGEYTHAEGYQTQALGSYSHAEGIRSIASGGSGAHVEGIDCIAKGSSSHAEGEKTQATGLYSHAEGRASIASGHYSHAECRETSASGESSHAEGYKSKASGIASHAEGRETEASTEMAHAEGYKTKAAGITAHAEGRQTIASGYASHAEGYGTIATSNSVHVQGRYNIEDTENLYAHIVGRGEEDMDRSNAHTLKWTGEAYFAGAVTSDGADYGEYYEWLDGNPNTEDRVGLLVTLDGEKIKLANEGDDILGVISGTAAIIGDHAECEWKLKYLHDNFGRVLYDENKRPKLNPDYDPTKEYISRADRAEWDVVGLLGKLYVRDDGTAIVNGYVSVGQDGIATASSAKTNMRVLCRVNKNIIKIQRN